MALFFLCRNTPRHEAYLKWVWRRAPPPLPTLDKFIGRKDIAKQALRLLLRPKDKPFFSLNIFSRNKKNAKRPLRARAQLAVGEGVEEKASIKMHKNGIFILGGRFCAEGAVLGAREACDAIFYVFLVFLVR